MQKLEILMPSLEAKFWTIATAIWTTVTAFWKLEDTHPKKSVLEVLKLGPKKKKFSKWSKKKPRGLIFAKKDSQKKIKNARTKHLGLKSAQPTPDFCIRKKFHIPSPIYN